MYYLRNPGYGHGHGSEITRGVLRAHSAHMRTRLPRVSERALPGDNEAAHNRDTYSSSPDESSYMLSAWHSVLAVKQKPTNFQLAMSFRMSRNRAHQHANAHYGNHSLIKSHPEPTYSQVACWRAPAMVTSGPSWYSFGHARSQGTNKER